MVDPALDSPKSELFNALLDVSTALFLADHGRERFVDPLFGTVGAGTSCWGCESISTTWNSCKKAKELLQKAIPALEAKKLSKEVAEGEKFKLLYEFKLLSQAIQFLHIFKFIQILAILERIHFVLV